MSTRDDSWLVDEVRNADLSVADWQRLLEAAVSGLGYALEQIATTEGSNAQS